MRQIVLTLGILVIAVGSGCSKGPAFVRSYGHSVIEIRELQPFNVVRVSQKFRLYLTNDTSKPESIAISYGSNLMKKISTQVESGVLDIKDQNHWNWVRDLKVHPVCTLNIHKLDRIEINGSAEVRCLDTLNISGINIVLDGVGSNFFLLNCLQVTGSCSNAGNVTMKGKGGLFAWTCENGSWIDAGDLRCDDAYVYHYTGRDITVNAGTILKAFVYGTGNLYYVRQPWYAFEKEEFGKGKVLKK